MNYPLIGFHARGELDRGRQHVGQVRLFVAQIIDIEEERAGDVLGQVFGLGVPAGGRKMPGGIEYDEIGRFEVRCKPIRIHDPVLGSIRHA